MLSKFYGEIFAILTSVCWAISALSFEIAGKKIGSLPMNLIRMSLALIFISIFSVFYNGNIIPQGANSEQLLYLVASGLVGFVSGDMLLFHSFVLIGA
ncbi:MAG: DMT family transporter, partial [Bacteroidales bacterium]|nr:DMT family transporter [Bacteroidales bacterium]